MVAIRRTKSKSWGRYPSFEANWWIILAISGDRIQESSQSGSYPSPKAYPDHLVRKTIHRRTISPRRLIWAIQQIRQWDWPAYLVIFYAIILGSRYDANAKRLGKRDIGSYHRNPWGNDKFVSFGVVGSTIKSISRNYGRLRLLDWLRLWWQIVIWWG